MSFNIRYANRSDGVNRWENRREMVIGVVTAFRPDIVGYQEVLPNQFDWLVQQMDGYDKVHAGRDDGRRAGESVPIFYRADRFRETASGHLWFSPTPDQPGSIGWGANLPRMMTYVVLQDRQTHQTLYIFNAHLDHQSETSRTKSTELIRETIRDGVAQGNAMIVMGDFNAWANSDAIQNLTQPHGEAFPGLTHAYRAVHPQPDNEEATFHGWTGRTRGGMIDFIFCTQALTPLQANIDRTNQDQRYPSDHYPVTAVLGYTQE